MLKDKWFSWKFAPWGQPVVQIKDYFGEKVGLYFAWLGACRARCCWDVYLRLTLSVRGATGHFTTWLIAPSLVGIGVFISVVVQGTADSNLVPYYGLFMALWSTYG